MSFTRIIFIGFCLTLLISCGKTASEDSLSKSICNIDLETNEIEVTSVVVSALLKKRLPKGEAALIVNETLVNHMRREMPEILKANSEKLLNGETAIVEDFELKNQSPRSFGKVLTLPNKYEYVSGVEFAEISKINPYMVKSDPVKKKFPDSAGLNGIFGFSRAGFNKDFSKAAIYAFKWYGEGYFFVLEKENCQWQIKREQMIWMH